MEKVSFEMGWLHDLGFVWYNEYSMIKNGILVEYDPAFEVWQISKVEEMFAEWSSPDFDDVLVEIRRRKLN